MAEPKTSRPEPAGYFMDAESGAGLLPWSHVVERMSGARNYWVATTRPDGRPHCMPVWGVWLDDAFWFSTSPISRKARNLGVNPNVVIHLESGADLVVVEGVSEEVREPASLERFVAAYNPKYDWDFKREQLEGGGLFRVRPRVAFSWLGDQGEAFSGTATRWQLDS